MKSFKQHITEAKIPVTKGWIHKSGKWNVWKYSSSLRPYHVQGVVKDPKKYGLTKNKIEQIIAKEWGLEAGDDEMEGVYDDLLSGKTDINKALYYHLFSKGWVKVVLGDGMHSLEGKSKDVLSVAKVLDKKYGEKSLFDDRGFMEIHNDSSRHLFDIGSSLDWREYLKTGKEPGKGRTNIGKTMAQFRDHVELEEGVRDIIKKLKKNRTVISVVRKLSSASMTQVMSALIAIPIVRDTLTSVDKTNQLRIVASGLKSIILGEENEN